MVFFVQPCNGELLAAFLICFKQMFGCNSRKLNILIIETIVLLVCLIGLVVRLFHLN